MKTIQKMHDVLVAETGEFHSFYFRSDADQFVERMTNCGLQVLRGISYIDG